MSNALTKLEPKFPTVGNLPDMLQERAACIAAYHANFEKAAQDQLGYAFLCGYELNQAKNELPHGQFLKWCEQALPQIPGTTADRYRAFAKCIQTQSKQIATLTAKPLQLTNGELPERERKIILDAVHDYADGATLTELYRDLNILRKPKPKEYHPPKLTAEQQAQAEEQAADEIAITTLGDLELLRDPKTQGLLTAARKRELLDAFVTCSKEFRALLKNERKAKKKGAK